MDGAGENDASGSEADEVLELRLIEEKFADKGTIKAAHRFSLFRTVRCDELLGDSIYCVRCILVHTQTNIHSTARRTTRETTETIKCTDSFAV